MKKLSGLIIFLFCAVVSFSQSGFPNNQTISNGSTLYHAKGGLVGDSGLVLVSFPDTSVANRGPFLKGTDGLMIRVADTIFMRVVSKSAWVNVSGGSGGGGGSGVQNVTYANGILCVYKTADTTCYTIRDYTIDSITVNADTTQYIAWNGGNTLFYFPTLMRTVTGIYPLSVLRISSDSFQIRCLTCNTLRDGLIQGGNISWSGTGLTYNITPALYVINGVQYTSPAGSFTLSDGDASFDRIDLIVLDSTGSVVVIPGTPAANPQFPQTTSPSSQLAINNFLVKSGATLPTGVTQTIIYDEQSAGEWPVAVQSGLVVNFGNTVNPFHLTKSADVGTWPTNRTITFTNISKLDRNDYTLLKMYIKLKAPLPSTANIQVLFQNGTVATTTYFSLGATHGFSKTTPDYQNITIPLSGIAFTSNVFDKVSIRFTGVGSGVYLDYIQLQGGISNGSSDFVENVFKRNDSLFQVKGGVPLFVTKISNGGITSPQAFLAGVLDSIATPVALPRNGSIYQVASAGLTGVFVGHPNQIATYDSVAGIYNFITADTGNLINNASNYVISQYTGSGWIRVGYMPLFQGGNDFKNPVVAGSKDSSNFEFRTVGQTRMTLDRISKYLLLSKGTGIGFYGEGGQPTAKLWFSDPTTSIYANGGDFNFETGLGRFVFYNSTGSVPQVQFRENFNWLKYKTKISDIFQQPQVSSIFDIESTTKGVLIPRMTAAQRLAIGGDITAGTLTSGGSGYTDGSYSFNPLTNLSGTGTGTQVNIVVSGGAVTTVNLIGGGGGQGYLPGDMLTSATIGPGTGFIYTVNILGSRGLLVWDTDSLSLFQYTGSTWQNLYNLGGGGGGGSYTASNGLSLSGSDIQLGGTLAAPTAIDLNSNQFSLVRGAYNALSFDPAHDTITIRHITGTGAESLIKLGDDNGYTANVNLRSTDAANGATGDYGFGAGGLNFSVNSSIDQKIANFQTGTGGVSGSIINTATGTTTTLNQSFESGDHPYINIEAAGSVSTSAISVRDTAINITTPILRINGVLYGSGGGGGGNTIYTGDDALTGSRTVDLAGNPIQFTQGGTPMLNIDPTSGSETVYLNVSDPAANDAAVVISSNASIGEFEISAGFNSGTILANITATSQASGSSITHTADSHVFNGKAQLNTVASGASTDSILTQDVSTGEVRRRSASFLSSTFQQILNNGSQLTKNDTVDVNGFAFRFNNGATPILTLLSTGLNGINKITPTEALDVTGNILGSGTILGTGRVSGGTASMTSAQAATELSDETGSASGGLAVYNNTPTIIAPNIGDATTATIGINSAVSTNTAIMYLSPVSSNATPLLYLRPSTGGTVAPAVVLNTSPTSATNSNSFSIGTGNATLPANTWNLASTLSGNASANSWPIGFLVSNTTSGRFTAMTVANSGGVGIGLTAPLSRLHITSGTTAANTAPLMLAGVAPALNTTPQKYAVEVDTATGGGNIYYSNALATRYTLAKTLTATSALNFASTAAGTNSDLTITVTGAADGDAVSLGVPNAAVNANSSFTSFVSAANTVTVRFNNYQAAGAIDPASATFRVSVIKY